MYKNEKYSFIYTYMCSCVLCIYKYICALLYRKNISGYIKNLTAICCPYEKGLAGCWPWRVPFIDTACSIVWELPWRCQAYSLLGWLSNCDVAFNPQHRWFAFQVFVSFIEVKFTEHETTILKGIMQWPLVHPQCVQSPPLILSCRHSKIKPHTF